MRRILPLPKFRVVAKIGVTHFRDCPLSYKANHMMTTNPLCAKTRRFDDETIWGHFSGRFSIIWTEQFESWR